MTQSLPPKSLVLYADDDPDDIELVRELLREFEQDMELVTFPNGVELLHYMEKLDRLQPSPCLIILDINMPQYTGKEILRELRKDEGFKDIPVVLFTTSTLPYDTVFAQKHHAGFLNKPLDASQLHQLVDQLLDHCDEETRRRLKRKRE